MSAEPNPESEIELARLADGRLPADQALAMGDRVAASADLSARLAEQERALALIRASETISAPASLHQSVRELTATRRRTARGARPGGGVAGSRWVAGVAGGIAGSRRVAGVAGVTAAAVIAALILFGGGAAPTVRQTARLALAPATRPAPPPDPADASLLALRVGAVAFPRYRPQSGWPATGARTDTLDGREVQTVFYRIAGPLRVGYSIVSGPSLRVPSGHAVNIGGVRYVLVTGPDGSLITWRRDGHTCVIAGRGVGDRSLLELARAAELT